MISISDASGRRIASDEISRIFAPGVFHGKSALITGGGSGINFGIAKCFAALGANLALCGRDPIKLNAAASELEAFGIEALPLPADVRNKEAVDSAFQQCEEKLGAVDVVICGAAGNFLCPAEELSSNGFRTVVDIDLVGSFHTAHAAFPQLCKTRGSIIFISAGQAFLPFAHQVHVGAAKAGVDNMMRNLAFEWGRFGIRCNSIAPGFIAETEGTRRLARDGLADQIEQTTPLGRLGSVQDIGHAAVFLASPLAAYITGTVVVVDGGFYLGGGGMFSSAVAGAVSK